MKYLEKIEVLLPLGYLYLIIIGIMKESIFFYQLDINILKYSSIMDVLISPIAILTSHPIAFITIISFISFCCFYLPNFLFRNGYKKWVQKIFELKKDKLELPENELINYYLYTTIKTLAIGLFSIYVGFGSAEGHFASTKIKNSSFNFNDKINFNTGESEDIYLLESNSMYYFYVAKNEKTVKIAPIAGIKYIEINKNKKPKG